MAIWRVLWRGLRTLANGAAVDRDVDEEVAHYLEQEVAQRIARGLPPDEARRTARLAIGGELRVREEVRASGWEHAIETALADLRYAIRRLRGEPGFAAASILILGMGIGAATAIFSAIKPILLEPLPYPHGERIATIWEIGADGAHIDGTFGMYRELASRARSFESLTATLSWRPTLAGMGTPERFDGQRVSASWFGVLGVSPSLGRSFTAAEDEPGAPGTVVLSHGLWQRRFGADPGIVGRDITLDGVPHTVVGIMPAGFANVLAPAADLWAPLQYGMDQERAWGHHLRLVGRLASNVSPAGALGEIRVIGQALIDSRRPDTYGDEVSFAVVPVRNEMTAGVRPALVATFGAVGLLLLIACANVANLQLARGIRREAEFALRRALGAAQGRLVRQLLIESLVLALCGAAAGIIVATAGIQWLIALAPAHLPRLDAIALDGASLAFSLVVATLAGLTLGVVPALRAARHDPARRLPSTAARVAGGHGARGVLVIGEVALALVLLASAGLLLRSVQRVLAVDPGFDAVGLLTMQVPTTGRRFDSAAEAIAASDRLQSAVRTVAGVQSVAMVNQLPLGGDEELYGLRFDPPIVADPGEQRGTVRYAVSPAYIETMRIPLIRGRLLTEDDDASAPPVALISASLAKRRLPGLDPIGRRLSVGPPRPVYTIVGVVGDVRHVSLVDEPAEAVYMTQSQRAFSDDELSLVIRTRGSPGALVPAIRQAIWSADAGQPIARVATMSDLLARSSADRRFALVLFQGFGLTALLLAAVGLSGLLAGRVAERTREIGVRATLGATRSRLVLGVVRQGMALAGAGIVIGLAAAVLATRALASLLFGVSQTDLATYGAVTALLCLVALAACAIPAWRAAHVDPARALRAE